MDLCKEQGLCAEQHELRTMTLWHHVYFLSGWQSEVWAKLLKCSAPCEFEFELECEMGVTTTHQIMYRLRAGPWLQQTSSTDRHSRAAKFTNKHICKFTMIWTESLKDIQYHNSMDVHFSGVFFNVHCTTGNYSINSFGHRLTPQRHVKGSHQLVLV